MQDISVDAASVIMSLVQDPRPCASVCRTWAQAIAALGLMVAPGDRHPRHPQLQGDSHLRVVYYMSVGYAPPNPGKFTSSVGATHPIWPFPIPAVWKHSLREELDQQGTADALRDGSVVKGMWQARSGKKVAGCGPLEVRYGYTDAVIGSLPPREDFEPIFAGIKGLLKRHPRGLAFPAPATGPVFAVGPLYAALPSPTYWGEGDSLIVVDCLGRPLNQPGVWADGRQITKLAWSGIVSPFLRRVSPTCLAVVSFSKGSRFAYCSAVVWWTAARGLQIRQLRGPSRRSDQAGWALPPLDADQYEIPVFVLEWDKEPPIMMPKKRARSDVDDDEQ